MERRKMKDGEKENEEWREGKWRMERKKMKDGEKENEGMERGLREG